MMILKIIKNNNSKIKKCINNKKMKKNKITQILIKIKTNININNNNIIKKKDKKFQRKIKFIKKYLIRINLIINH